MPSSEVSNETLGREIADQLERRRLLHGKVAGPGALEGAVRIRRGPSPLMTFTDTV